MNNTTKEIIKILTTVIICIFLSWAGYSLLCKWADYTWLEQKNRERVEQLNIAKVKFSCVDKIIEKDIVGVSLNRDLSGSGSMSGSAFGFIFFGMGNVSGDFSIETVANYYFYLKEDDGSMRLSQEPANKSKIFEKDIKPDEAKIRYVIHQQFYLSEVEMPYSRTPKCSRTTTIEFIIPKGTITPFYNLIP